MSQEVLNKHERVTQILYMKRLIMRISKILKSFTDISLVLNNFVLVLNEIINKKKNLNETINTGKKSLTKTVNKKGN